MQDQLTNMHFSLANMLISSCKHVIHPPANMQRLKMPVNK
nr:hypothetical protein [Providencia rettgeri]